MHHTFEELTARTGVLVRSPVSVPPVEVERRTFEEQLEEFLQAMGLSQVPVPYPHDMA